MMEADPNVTLAKAREALETGEYDIALDYFEEMSACAAGLESEDRISFLAGRGYCLWRLGYYEEAVCAYDEALKLDPRNQQLLVDKGSVLSEDERWDEALECFEAAIKLDAKHSPDAWAHKARAEKELGQKNEARESFRHWLEFLKGENEELQAELCRLWKDLFVVTADSDLEGLSPAVIEMVRKKKQLPPEILEALNGQE